MPKKPEPIYAITLVILALAAAESVVAWQALRREDYEGRIAGLEKSLADKSAEINRLIFIRDSENRRHLAAEAALVDGGDGDAEDTAAQAMLADGYAEPPAPRRPARRDAATSNGAAALAARRPAPSPLSRLSPAEPARPGDTAGPQALIPAIPNPLMDEALADEARAEAEAARPIGPSDIDLKRLVNMANIMTGREVAELTRLDGDTVIHYRASHPAEDDPIWHVLGAIRQAHALKDVVIAGRSESDLPRRRQLMQSLVRFGLPSSLIRLQTGDRYDGLEGILIGIAPSAKNQSRASASGRGT